MQRSCQPRAATEATAKCPGELRSQWSDADLAQHDWHGKSRSHDRRLGDADLVDLSDVDDEGSTHEQPSGVSPWSIRK